MQSHNKLPVFAISCLQFYKMTSRRFPVRVFLVVLLGGTVIYWALNVRDWTNIDGVTRDSEFKVVSEFEDKADSGPGRRSLFKVEADRRRKGESGKSDVGEKNYSADRHPWMFPRPLSELENKAVPNQVFFIWCQDRTFTVNDYLSVLSVWKLLEPEKIEIHRDANITTDNYNQWFQELNTTVPVFSVHSVNRRRSICLNPLYYALEVLSDRGGIFVDFSTVLLRPIHSYRNQGFSVGFSEEGNVSFVISQIQSPQVHRILEIVDIKISRILTMLEDSAEKGRTLFCPPVSASLPIALLTTTKTTTMCATLSPDSILNPLDLYQMENGELTILKDLFYLDQTKEGECLDAHRKKTPIPFIVHYVWFGAEEFSFRMYLSFLSTVHVAKAERVFIHSDQQLSGQYWRLVSAHPRVTVVYREMPRTIYGRPVLYTQHFSDVVRADVLDKYGGLYLDWDVLWLKSPAPLLLSGHDAVVDLDHMPHPDFPEVLNLGVFLCRPRARFVRLWRWELRNYRSRDFYYNALELPFKVYERHPDSVFIEPRLQVMCFWLKCHPIFHPDHKDWSHGQPFDWRSDVYSIHFTHPDPEEFDSIVALLNSTGTFAQIGRFILDVSGELSLKGVAADP